MLTGPHVRGVHDKPTTHLFQWLERKAWVMPSTGGDVGERKVKLYNFGRWLGSLFQRRTRTCPVPNPLVQRPVGDDVAGPFVT